MGERCGTWLTAVAVVALLLVAGLAVIVGVGWLVDRLIRCGVC